MSPQIIRIANNSGDIIPSDHKTIVDNSVIEGEFVFNNCVDVHIGPKYENTNNIVINQNISVSSEGELQSDFEIALKKELEKSTYNVLFYKNYSINQYCLQHRCIVLAAFSLSAILMFFTILLLITPSKDASSDKKIDKGNRSLPMSTEQLTNDYPVNLKFVWRDSWGASQPTGELRNNTLPVHRVIFIHTVSAGTCNKYSACKQTVLTIQELHMDVDHNYGDIGYNFVIGSDGYIYVGVGWDKVGAHTKGFNTGSLGVAFVGDFRTDKPNDLMLSSAKTLLEFGVLRKKLSEDYQLFGHCQTLSDFPFSPGKNILNEIKTWPNWNDTNLVQCAGL